MARYSQEPISESGSDIVADFKKNGYQNIREISGIGDAAVWTTWSSVHPSTHATTIWGSLTVKKGNRILLVITVRGQPNEATSMEKAKAVALKVLPNL